MIPEEPDPYRNPLVLLISATVFSVFAAVMGYLMRAMDSGHKISFPYSLVVAGSAGVSGIMIGALAIEIKLSIWYALAAAGLFGWMGAAAALKIGKALFYKAVKLTAQEVNDAGTD